MTGDPKNSGLLDLSSLSALWCCCCEMAQLSKSQVLFVSIVWVPRLVEKGISLKISLWTRWRHKEIANRSHPGPKSWDIMNHHDFVETGRRLVMLYGFACNQLAFRVLTWVCWAWQERWRNPPAFFFWNFWKTNLSFFILYSLNLRFGICGVFQFLCSVILIIDDIKYDIMYYMTIFIYILNCHSE